MGDMAEIDVLKAIDSALSGLENQDARNRVLQWAWQKYSSKPTPSVDGEKDRAEFARKAGRKAPRTKGKAKSKAKTSLAIVKELNLKPKDKQPFDAFAETKKPSSIYEKCVVSAHYLKHELSIPAITENHIYTCFKHMSGESLRTYPTLLH